MAPKFKSFLQKIIRTHHKDSKDASSDIVNSFIVNNIIWDCFFLKFKLINFFKNQMMWDREVYLNNAKYQISDNMAVNKCTFITLLILKLDLTYQLIVKMSHQLP